MGLSSRLSSAGVSIVEALDVVEHVSFGLPPWFDKFLRAVRSVLSDEKKLSIEDLLSTGCQWQALPKNRPPKSTAHSYFMLWDWPGTLERVHHALYVATREREGREASPTAAIIDSQRAEAAQKGAPRLTRRGLMRPRGHRPQTAYPGRHARPAVERRVHSAAMQDRDAVSLRSNGTCTRVDEGGAVAG
jgi:transposase